MRPNENPTPCSCQDTEPANSHVPKHALEELEKRRAEEYRQHLLRTGKENDVLILAPANTPLQYPLKGFRVTPMRPTLIPGELAIGQNEKELRLSSNSLLKLNEMLSRVTYTSTIYHIRTEDLVYFSFEDHEVVFPIEIRRLSVPVLFDPGKDVNSQVTVVVKAFLRYKELNLLVNSIRWRYPKIKIIVADDSLEPQKVEGENLEHYLMPPAKGWFAGRNLAVSQVSTKYFLWVDDDFVFLNNTRIERFVEIMEANPELDVVGGQVESNSFFFKMNYEEGTVEEGGCITRVFHTHAPLPGFDGCFFADGVVNYFLGRTAAVRKVGFDPFLKRVAHTEFFVDGLGDLLIVTCQGLEIGHQKHSNTDKYLSFRQPSKWDSEAKMTHHFFKNHLKCMKY
ncbi:hypothetical protein DNTS_001466 [Danionella cerebrum]|uniref:Glycosyltransferase 2-like domain-containing protein n=1 Tax=Danionella cerebrum TaxID=2873325 RepID=A0A553R4F3_9TELE|nr:hypothetical protein DNTS_001466 [Danionella translucida]